MDKLVKDYSMETKYKLFLCVAFCVDIDIILLDEPFSSLGLVGQRETEKMMEEFVYGGGIVLITTHIKQYIEKYSENHLIIERRKILNARQK